jgi:hypothetical protein
MIPASFIDGKGVLWVWSTYRDCFVVSRSKRNKIEKPIES